MALPTQGPHASAVRCKPAAAPGLPPLCAASQRRGAVDAEDDGEDSTDEGAGGGGGGGRGRGRASKKGKSAADAASVKACREKARREKLNEW